MTFVNIPTPQNGWSLPRCLFPSHGIKSERLRFQVFPKNDSTPSDDSPNSYARNPRHSARGHVGQNVPRDDWWSCSSWWKFLSFRMRPLPRGNRLPGPLGHKSNGFLEIFYIIWTNHAYIDPAPPEIRLHPLHDLSDSKHPEVVKTLCHLGVQVVFSSEQGLFLMPTVRDIPLGFIDFMINGPNRLKYYKKTIL